MKLSKALLQAILVAVTVGAISSCEKPTVDAAQKSAKETPKEHTPDGCPACGMG